MAATPSTGPKKAGAFSRLSKGQQYALLAAGGVGVYFLYRWYQNNQASSANTAATTAGSATSPTDTSGGGGFIGGGGGGGGGGGLANAIQTALNNALAGLPASNPLSPNYVPPSQTPAASTTSATTGTTPVSTPAVSSAPTGSTTQSVIFGGTTAQPGANEPTVSTPGGPTYSGISDQATAQALINRGFTLYKNVNGTFVPASSAAGKASSNKGLYYNPAQTGVH